MGVTVGVALGVGVGDGGIGLGVVDGAACMDRASGGTVGAPGAGGVTVNWLGMSGLVARDGKG